MKYSLVKYLPLLLLLLAACSTSNQTEDTIKYNYDGIINTEDLQLTSGEAERYAVNMLIEAKKAEEKRNFALSLIYYQNAIKADSSASLLYMAGNAYFELGFLDEAKTMLKLSLQKDNNFTQSLKKLIEVYILQKDFKKAEILTNKFKNNAETNDDLLQASTYYEKFNIQKSIELLEQLLKVQDEPRINARLLSQYYFNDMEDEYYTLLYNNLINDYDIEISNLVYLAFYLIQKKQSDKFINIIKKINTYYTISDLEYFYGKLSSSLSAYEGETAADMIEIFLDNIDEINFKNSEINYNCGIISFNAGKKKKAESYFQKAMQSEEFGSLTALQIGMFYYFNEEYDKSKSILTNKEYDFGDYWEDEYFLAQLHLVEFELSEAVDYFKKSLEINSNNVFVYADLGLTYDRMGDKDSAVHFYEIGLKLDSNNIVLLNNLAYYLIDMGIRIEEAEKMINKVLAVEPDNPIYLDTYGWLLFKQEKYSEAKKYLLKANEDSEKNAEILYHIAMVYYKLGNIEQAKKYLGEAKLLEPENKGVLELFKEINSP